MSEDEKKSQLLQQEYNRSQEIIAELDQQLVSITSQLQEHTIVDQTLTSIEPKARSNRKCFKMIGGVLVEKSVDEVILILNDEMKQLKTQKELITKELDQSRHKLQDWITKNKIKVVKS